MTVRLVLLGQKTFGKSATGNTLLRKEVFATCQNEYCQVEEGEVAGRRITVIDTPGWYMNVSQCNQKTDEEIVRSLSLSPLGFHAVLLVVPLDLTFYNDTLKSVFHIYSEWRQSSTICPFI
uniref:AIG1-type G domain-containing protein n=1 Tax=Sphaeramia orbicularis TaxID=375764 RepID=A0A673B7Q3_9TELE